MILTLVPMQGYSTGNDTREGLQLKWQYGHAGLRTLKRTRGVSVRHGKECGNVGADVSMLVG